MSNVFSGADLRRWMREKGVSMADLAEEINVDTSTVSRYITGKLAPNPDTMYQICEYMGDTSKWADWMRTEYPRSYGRMHPAYPAVDSLPGRLLQLFAEWDDVEGLKNALMRDAADGKIDEPMLRERFEKELQELIGAGNSVEIKIKG